MSHEQKIARRRLRREILSLDMDEAERLIEVAFPTADPVETYWDMFERAEMAAELAEDF